MELVQENPTSTETGPAEVQAATPETQPQQAPSRNQPDSGVSPELGNNVPEEPNNVEKVKTDGNLASSIDGKIPEGLASKEEWLHTLLAKEKESPGIEFNDDELDILEEHWEGRLEPKAPKPKEEVKSEEDPKPDEGKEEPKEEDNSIEAVLKEVGAKSETELLKKVKDLRKVVTGKVKSSDEYKTLETQAKQLNQKFQNELHLMEDVKAGVPEAISHLEKAYGITIAKPGKPEPKPKADEAETEPSDEYLDEIAGKEISQLKKMVKELKEELGSVQGNTKKIQEKFANERAEAQIIDEMVHVAERVPALKEIQNLRGAIKAWRGGKEDTRLDGFNTVFKIANEKGVDLLTAHEILAGRNASFEIEKARKSAKEEVYTQKPNRSLSNLQGKGVENKPSYTDDQVEEMINTGDLPNEWFDEFDQPNPRTIPRQYLKYFFAPQEIGK